MVYTHEQLLRMLADVIISRFPISDLELLLQAGTNPNSAVIHGLRPIHYAAFAGGDQMYIDKLVEYGAVVNCMDNVGYTPLHVAAKAGNRDAVRSLIRHGADVNGVVPSGEDSDENTKLVSSLVREDETTRSTEHSSAVDDTIATVRESGPGDEVHTDISVVMPPSQLEHSDEESNAGEENVVQYQTISGEEDRSESTTNVELPAGQGHNPEAGPDLAEDFNRLRLGGLVARELDAGVDDVHSQQGYEAAGGIDTSVNQACRELAASSLSNSEAVNVVHRACQSSGSTALSRTVDSEEGHEIPSDVASETSTQEPALIATTEETDSTAAVAIDAPLEAVSVLPGDAQGALTAVHGDSDTASSLTDSPLSIAVEYGHVECVEELLIHHANPNISSFLGSIINTMPLEHTKCLKLLLHYGADPDSLSRGGMTPLMRAAKQQQVDAVRILLEHGADVNIQCPPRFDQRRAIHFATIVGNLEIVNLLLAAGAYSTKPPDYSCAPLEYAIIHNKAEICLALLRHGADPDELNEDGCTPLQVLCASSTLTHLNEMIGYLLCAGANPNLHSEQFSYTGPSLCPIVEYLTYNDDLDFTVLKLMLQYGARVNFTVPTRLLKIQDACGVLGQLRKLRPHEDILDLIMDAAEKFDAEAIKRDNTLSNGKRAALVETATNARSLKRLARIKVIDSIVRKKHSTPDDWYSQLPLPNYLIRYVMFETV